MRRLARRAAPGLSGARAVRLDVPEGWEVSSGRLEAVSAVLGPRWQRGQTGQGPPATGATVKRPAGLLLRPVLPEPPAGAAAVAVPQP